MPVGKIKNLILLILALAVCFLLVLVIPSKTAQAREEAAVHERLQTLFAGYDVQLSGDELPASARLYTIELENSRTAESAAAAALLGAQSEPQDSSVRYSSVYTSPHGSCKMNASGSFSASLDGWFTASDPVTGTRTLLKAMGFDAASVSGPERVSAGVYTVTAAQQILGVPAFSEGLRFTYTNGALTDVSGIFFLSGSVTRVSENACISCADALVALLAARNTLGWVGSRITDVRQGYEHTETASASVRLVPVWQIDTDTGAFRVNGITREITAITASS